VLIEDKGSGIHLIRDLVRSGELFPIACTPEEAAGLTCRLRPPPVMHRPLPIMKGAGPRQRPARLGKTLRSHRE
jgi:hypothetical protein